MEDDRDIDSKIKNKIMAKARKRKKKDVIYNGKCEIVDELDKEHILILPLILIADWKANSILYRNLRKNPEKIVGRETDWKLLYNYMTSKQPPDDIEQIIKEIVEIVNIQSK